MATDNISIEGEDFKRWEKHATLLSSSAMICEWDYFGYDSVLRKSLGKFIRRYFPDFRMKSNRCPFLYKKGSTCLCVIQVWDPKMKPSTCRGFRPGSRHAKAFCNCPA